MRGPRGFAAAASWIRRLLTKGKTERGPRTRSPRQMHNAARAHSCGMACRDSCSTTLTGREARGWHRRPSVHLLDCGKRYRPARRKSMRGDGLAGEPGGRRERAHGRRWRDEWGQTGGIRQGFRAPLVSPVPPVSPIPVPPSPPLPPSPLDQPANANPRSPAITLPHACVASCSNTSSHPPAAASAQSARLLSRVTRGSTS